MSRTARPVALALWLAAAVPAGATTQAKIVDPRPNSAVVDLTRTLGDADVQAIDALAVRGRAGGELMVVVIDSVSGATPRAFTTQLFNRWGLDGRQRNRGVMLLVAIQDRKAEIVIGDGYPDAVTGVTDRIMSDVVVARFKAGRPRDAIVEASRAIVDEVILVTEGALPSAQEAPAPAAQQSALPAASPSLFRRLADGAAENPVLPLGGGVGGAVAGGALLRRYMRNRPRRCAACRTVMTRLEEIADDAHLSSGEKVEERVGSVDYDVWACRCGQATKLRYGTLFTSYGRCQGCQAKTLKATTTTLVSATTSSEGRARVDESCAHCSFARSYERSIPRVQRSSSSSRSSSGGSSSGRGSSGSW